MALLLSAQAILKAYGVAPLFHDLSLGIHDGDRVGMVGPNGSGKSTLLRVLAGIEEPDHGSVISRRLARSAYVAQHPHFAAGASVRDVVGAALAGVVEDEGLRGSREAAMLSRLGFRDPDARVGELSGGWQKRVALAAALVAEPDLLLLDEPTNHLDLDGILWLEELLASREGACVFVSHDRWFLERVATRIFDLDPMHEGGFFESTGRYSDFLERKDQALREQERWQATLANRVRREVEWLRRGPKARSTKSRSRIDEAARLQEDLSQVSARLARRELSLPMAASQRRTRRLLACEHLGKDYAGRTIVRDANLVLSPGTRVGLLGPNGSGKTTLIRMLTGQLEPDRGRVESADDLRIALLDQHRSAIDPSLTLRRALAPAGDQVVFAGRPLHVAAWARRFLFRSEQLSVPVGKLSGGEQARVLLAGLMLAPADVLVLDEPTNDLDIPTLEVLEESLIEFPGAVILVTHDRYLFQRVTTTVLALDGNGNVTACADYEQWEAERGRAQAPDAQVPGAQLRDAQRPDADSAAPGAPPRGAAAASRPKKLGYLEQREWEEIEARILAAEQRQAAAEARAHDPSIVSDAGAVAERYRELELACTEVENLYARWAELEEKRLATS